MFERFTERARRVLFFARYEASQLGSVSIETDHLLLGLIREGKGITGRLFTRAQLPLDGIRAVIEGRATGGAKFPTSVEIPFTAQTKRVLQHAAQEADRLLHNHIGREHLLLGILREEESAAAAILMQHGMRIEAVREDIVRLLNDRAFHDPAVVSREEPLSSSVAKDAGSGPSSFLEVRVSPATGAGLSITGRPGAWNAACDLRTLLSRISDCPMARVELPSWLDKGERYDFSIRYSPDQREEVRNRLMLAWIEAHFRISVTRESRAMDVYVLTAPQGLNPAVKGRPEESGGRVTSFGSMAFSVGGTPGELPALGSLPGHVSPPAAFMNAGLAGSITNIFAPGTTLAEFGQLLEQGLDRFVVDETGLNGRYDLQVTGEAKSTDELRERLRDQLGLVLTLGNRDVTMLVVRSTNGSNLRQE